MYDADVDAICVSAANGPYARNLIQLLWSVERRGVERRYRWIVYDMGVWQKHRSFLERRFPWCEIRDMPLGDLPDCFDPRTGTYCFKPWVIWQVFKDATVPVIWMDSATIVTSDLSRVAATTKEIGLFVLRGQTEIRHRCDPAIRRELELPPDLDDMRECFSGFVGADPNNNLSRSVMETWYRYSFRKELFLPDRITSERHMHDQAVLTCLVLPLIANGQLAEGEDVDISAPYPLRDVTTRNKLPGTMPLSLDPFCRLYYWIYKTVDRIELRIKDRLRGRSHPCI